VTPTKYDIKQLVKHIYNKSILGNFMFLCEKNEPHFPFHDDKQTKYIALEHFTVEAKMALEYLSLIKKNFDLDTERAFIDILIRETNKNLQKYFLNYLDNKAKVINLPFYKSTGFEKLIKYFSRNPRRFLTKKPNELEKKKAINTAIYFKGILKEFFMENFNFTEDAICYIIISPQLGQFIRQHINEFERGKYENSYGIHLFGYIPSLIMDVYINPFSTNTLYFGTIKKSTEKGITFFYNTVENALTEHQSPIGSQVYRLNLYHTIAELGGRNKFKKIIFDL